jgi:hypothetical protein
MLEPQPRPDLERRHPRISHEQLRRHLIDADEDRYRLRNELASAVPAPSRGGSPVSNVRRRFAIGAGIVIVSGLAGGIVWQMCPSSARADDRSGVRLHTETVTPRIVRSETAAANPAPLSAAERSNLKPRVRSTLTPDRARVQAPRPRSVPRPLSPGEFGRPRIASDDVQP